jgi:hypothetical protein
MKTLSSLFSGRSWHYSFGFHSDLDFCFWVLERDGLRVPPFDRHSDGDSSLRAAGLDVASWWVWLERTLAARDERRDFLRAVARQEVDRKPPRSIGPAALWDGVPAVGQRLLTLAEEFEAFTNERAAIKLGLVETHNACDAQLWRDLAPYRRKLPPVQIVAIGYPGPAQAVVPPDTILLALGNWPPTPAELSATILDGMQALANSAQSRRRLR